MLNFKEEGMLELHCLTEQLNFLVAIPIYNEWEKTQFQYLLNNIKSTRLNSFEICKWCISHRLAYKILYPLRKSSILKNPYKYYKYLQMKFYLRKYQQAWENRGIEHGIVLSLCNFYSCISSFMCSACDISYSPISPPDCS